MARTGITAIVYSGLLVLLTSFSWAQGANSTDSETISQLVQEIRQLEQQDRDLRERISVLEGKQGAISQNGDQTTLTPPPDTQGAPPAPTPAPVRDWHDLRDIEWRGFGEVNYKVLNQRKPETAFDGFEPGSAGNFYTSDFGLFLTSNLTDKASVLSEIVFQEGQGQSYKVDLRRLLLKYDYNDNFKISFGRYQTNIGYYNWAFRSASWLQTTADRPLIMEYASNGGLLPTQAIGVSLTGAIPSGKLGLNYVAEYGSSDTVRPDINGDGLLNDENNGNQVNIGFFIRPESVPGLQTGASYYHDKISNFVQGPRIRYGQSIVNGYVVYTAHAIEFLNEGFLIRDSALHLGTAVFNTPAFYTQISRQISQFRPFIRYQYVNARPNDSIYGDVGLRYGPSFGLRYDLNSYIAFTAQLDHTIRRGEPDLNGLQLQWAFTF